MKKLLFITGTRADYGKLRPLLEEVERASEFECHIFATGMHTLSRYGSTFDEIRKAGFRNIFLFMNQFADGSSMDMVLAHTIQGLAHYVREFTPDMIVVHGDRIEAMAGALVGSLNNILVAHIEGGERSGTIDELIRHSISKLAHLHFVAHDEARARVIQMGECDSSVFVIGSPDIDVMLSDRLPSLSEARARYEIPFERFGIFIYHPVTTELDNLRAGISEVREALVSSRLNYVVVYPNNDTGAEVIMEELASLRAHPRFRMFPSLRFEHFLTLLKHAHVIVGNSSAGIREAPVYGVPTINIGSRQADRFDAASILHVSENRQEILAALSALPGGLAPCMHFGSGDSAERFMRHLGDPQIWQTPRQKQFRDLSDPAPISATEMQTQLAAPPARTKAVRREASIA